MSISRIDNRTVHIEYADSAGVITTRRINAVSFFSDLDESCWYVDAFCFMRNERRTFRVDRIIRITDARLSPFTFLDGDQWMRLVLEKMPAADKNFDSRPPEQDVETMLATGESIIAQHFHAMRVLYYIAKADKAFRAAEKRLYTMFLHRVAGHRMDSDALREHCIKVAMAIDPPTTGQFNYSVRQIKGRTRKYRMAVCATAKAMLNSDKKTSSYEEKLFKYLISKLNPLEE